MNSPDDQRRRRTAEVVMYRVRRRGLTGRIFADRLDTSVSLVDKIKNADRQLDLLEVRRRSLTRTIIADIMRSYPRNSSIPAQLSKLARATGVTT